MSGVNKVILVGRIGQDPKTSATQNGGQVCNYSMATSESYKNKQGEKVENTEWHNIVSFGKLAEISGKYLRKGSQVYIEGSLKTDKYEKDGVTRYSTKIVAREMQMLDSKSDNQSPNVPSGAQGIPDFDDDMDSIPF